MSHARGAQPTSRPAVPASRSSQLKSVALYVVQALLAVFFVLVGALPALTADAGAKGTFEDIGFGLWFMYLTGALELLGAIALLTPWLSGPAALGLMGVMAGACLTHLTLYDGRGISTPALILIPLALVAWGRWGTVRQLLSRLRGGSRAGAAPR